MQIWPGFSGFLFVKGVGLSSPKICNYGQNCCILAVFIPTFPHRRKDAHIIIIQMKFGRKEYTMGLLWYRMHNLALIGHKKRAQKLPLLLKITLSAGFTVEKRASIRGNSTSTYVYVMGLLLQQAKFGP